MTRIFNFFSLVVFLLFPTLTGCGTTVVPAPSFSLRVHTVATTAAPSVLLASVDELELVIAPRNPARFVELPCGHAFDDCGGISCCKYDDGAIATFISAAGEYVLRINGTWVRSHAQVIDSGFSVIVPVFATSTLDSPGALEPVARATVLRRSERIAVGSITLTWPLHGGASQDLAIMCWPDFESQCVNVDPSIPLDGGP